MKEKAVDVLVVSVTMGVTVVNNVMLMIVVYFLWRVL